MGFYIRKSVSVGPFRFNFSKSGIGVSAGIKGLRVGTGPRGNYVHVGRGGLYYRATIPSGSPSIPAPSTPSFQPGPESIQPMGVGPMVAIESASVMDMQDTSSAELLNELNGKARRPNYWKWVGGFGIAAIGIAINNQAPEWAVVTGTLLLLAFVSWVYVKDTLAKSSVLMYDLEPENELAFEALHSAIATLGACSNLWRIDTQGAVHDRKYHAGASSLVTRKAISAGKGLPPEVKSNIDVPFIDTKKVQLYFMPDRVLVYSPQGVGAIPYQSLNVNGGYTQFVEGESVPRDAEVVGRTWKYVNKKGGPDKRFKDNRELPVVRYGEVHLTSESGLNELLQTSRHSLDAPLLVAMQKMKASLPHASAA